MTTKPKFCIVILMTVLIMSCLFATVYADVIVGVKKGDMITYHVKNTGNVPPEHDVTNATIEVVNVSGKIVDIKFTSVFLNGTEKIDYATLNLETGNLGEGFIIPANLTKGDIFVEEKSGNITITDVEERVYAGEKRVTLTANNIQGVYYWDQPTGFLLEAKSTYSNFTISTTAIQTNIWQTQPYELDPLLAIVLVVGVIAVIIVVVVFRMKKK
jgi:hypothetical protein